MQTLRRTLAVLAVLLALPLSAEPLRVRGEVAAPRGAAIRVELFPSVASFEETVRELAGEPLRPIVSAPVRADGRFEVQAPGSGRYRLVVWAEGLLPLEQALEPLVEEAELPPVELEPAAKLEVQVVDAKGLPLAGIPVLMVSTGGGSSAGDAAPVGWPEERRGRTGTDGLVTFPRGRSEKVGLWVAAPGFLNLFVQEAAGARQTLRLERRPAGFAEVVDAHGRPVGGALVRWRSQPLGVTGPDGRLDLPVAERGAALSAEDAQGRWAEVELALGEPRGGQAARLSLQPPRLVTGRVLDSRSRTPLADALVWSDGGPTAKTGTDGSFQVRLTGTDRKELQAAASGHVPTFQEVEVRDGSPEPATILLEPAGGLAGIVIDPDGRPVAGAEIETRAADARSAQMSSSPRPVRTGQDGRFRLTDLALHALYEVTARRDGFASSSTQGAAAGPGQAVQPLRIVLGRGAIVRGRVVDATGRPMPGVRLGLWRMQERTPGFRRWERTASFQDTSGPSGELRFEHVEAGAFLLAGRPRGFAPAVREDIEVPAGIGEVDLGDIPLVAGATLEGLVTDRRGKPLAGANVWFMLDDPSFAWMAREVSGRSVQAGADGRFRIEDLPEGETCSLSVQAAGYASRELDGVEVPPAEPLRIELQPARALSGRVVGPRGEPIAEAQIEHIEALDMGAGGMNSVSIGGLGQTDATGRFRLENLEPGLLHLSFRADGYRRKSLEGIEVPEDREPSPLEVVLDRGAVLQGRVLKSDGRPVEGIEVWASSQEAMSFGDVTATSDAEGAYRLEGLETGSTQITAGVRGQRPQAMTTEVRPGVNELDITLRGGSAEVSGRVVGPDGAPVSGASVRLLPVDRQHGAFFDGASASDGSFRLEGVEDGVYRLAAAGSGFAQGHPPEEVRVAGAPVQGLEIRLSRGTTLAGRILGLTPDKARGIEVRAMSPEAAEMPAAGLSVEGTYRIPSLSPGLWHVMAITRDGRTARDSVTISPGMEEAPLDLTFNEGVMLSGQVLLDGAPLPGAQVLARIEGTPPPQAQSAGTAATSYDGRFRIAGLHPGTYRLQVAGPGGVGHVRTVDLAADQEVSIDIPTGALTGLALSADGEPVAEALVSLRGQESGGEVTFQGSRVRSSEQGAFEIPRLAVGSYVLKVEKEGFAPAETRITVTPGGTTEVRVVLRPGS